MNKKILVAIVFIVIIIIVASGWLSDEGSNIEINGVNFNIPEEFDKVETSSRDFGEEYIFENNNEEYIDIIVIDINNNEYSKESFYNSMFLGRFWMAKKDSIDGKEGYILNSNERSLYVYCDNDKGIMINVPLTYKDGDNVLKYNELLSKIIK